MTKRKSTAKCCCGHLKRHHYLSPERSSRGYCFKCRCDKFEESSFTKDSQFHGRSS